MAERPPRKASRPVPVQEHAPKSDTPTVLSPEKRKFFATARPGSDFKQPRLAVFQHAMNRTPRPTEPSESIAYGYMNLNKFHDREPEAVMLAIREIDPHFWDDYPRRPGKEADDDFVKAAIGEAARAFYRHGLAAYGKPGLRKEEPNGALSAI